MALAARSYEPHGTVTRCGTFARGFAWSFGHRLSLGSLQNSVALIQTPNTKVLITRTATKGTPVYRNSYVRRRCRAPFGGAGGPRTEKAWGRIWSACQSMQKHLCCVGSLKGLYKFFKNPPKKGGLGRRRFCWPLNDYLNVVQ